MSTLMNFIVTLIASWRRFSTAMPFFFHQFGVAVENRRHILPPHLFANYSKSHNTALVRPPKKSPRNPLRHPRLRVSIQPPHIRNWQADLDAKQSSC